VTLVAVLLGFFLAAQRPMLFDPYFGGIPPILALVAICSSGWVALYFLNANGYFVSSRPQSRRRGLTVAASLAVPFMALVTVVDLAEGFPKEINVPLPDSLLFYPVMGYVVALLLHAIPLALLLPLVGKIFRSWAADSQIALCIVAVASLETVFQLSQATRHLAVFTAIHLFLFGLVELYIFRRFDFISMYAFRIIYYAYWHVAWGHMRLLWLF
jgi:hypothetical protein